MSNIFSSIYLNHVKNEDKYINPIQRLIIFITDCCWDNAHSNPSLTDCQCLQHLNTLLRCHTGESSINVTKGYLSLEEKICSSFKHSMHFWDDIRWQSIFLDFSVPISKNIWCPVSKILVPSFLKFWCPHFWI